MRSCLVADDHALFRSALVALIVQRWPDADVIEAGDFPQAWDAAVRLRSPSLAVLDLDMPGAAPRAGVAGLQAASPETKVLILTGIGDDRLLRDLLVAGVSGFAQKTASPEIISAALELVAAGGQYLPPRVSELLHGNDPRHAALSPRQSEVLRLIARGFTNKEIAIRLEVSPATIKTHVAQLFTVIGATNRTEAAAMAHSAGLG